MSDLDTRLDQALKADAPAPRDPMFRIEVLLRRERAAFRRRLLTAGAMVLGIAILAALGLGAIGDWVRPGPEQTQIVMAAAVVLATALGVADTGCRRPRRRPDPGGSESVPSAALRARMAAVRFLWRRPEGRLLWACFPEGPQGSTGWLLRRRRRACGDVSQGERLGMNMRTPRGGHPPWPG